MNINLIDRSSSIDTSMKNLIKSQATNNFKKHSEHIQHCNLYLHNTKNNYKCVVELKPSGIPSIVTQGEGKNKNTAIKAACERANRTLKKNIDRLKINSNYYNYRKYYLS